MKKNICIMVMVLVITGLGLYGQSISVGSPAAGGKKIFVGQKITITWTKSGAMPDTVKIRLRRANSGESEPAVWAIADSTANTGSFGPVTIPASVPQGNYFIRVRTSDPDVIGDSANFWIIDVPPVSQNTPGSGNLQPQGPPQGIAKVEPAFPKPDFVAVRLDHQQGNGMLSISIMNQGTAAFDGLLPVRVQFICNGTDIFFDDTSPLAVNLAPGETKYYELAPVLTLKTIIARGNINVDARLDPDGKIPEKNEYNNHLNVLIPKTAIFYIDSLEIKVEPSTWSGLMGGYPKNVNFSMTIKGVGSGTLNFKVTRLGGEKVFSQSFTLANQVSPGVWESGTYSLCTIYEGDVEFYVTATVIDGNVLGDKVSNSVHCRFNK